MGFVVEPTIEIASAMFGINTESRQMKVTNPNVTNKFCNYVIRVSYPSQSSSIVSLQGKTHNGVDKITPTKSINWHNIIQ